MNFKEFNAYKHSMLSQLVVNPDGSTSNDNNKRFSLSYIGGSVESEKIIAKTIADAVFRSCINIIISKLPNVSDVQADNEGKFNELFKKLVNLHYFDVEIEDSKIVITESIGEKKTYELTYDNTDENPIDSLLKITIDDNIVKTWINYEPADLASTDSNTIISIIAGSPYSITEYKISDTAHSFDNFRMLSEYLRLIASYIDLYIGFASFNEKDPGNKFSKETTESWTHEKLTEEIENFGIALSYKRAILEKIMADKANYIYINNNNKKMRDNIDMTIRKTDRTVRTLTKRAKQIKEQINDCCTD